jgi:DNA-binding FrmR family transcriptional regulator
MAATRQLKGASHSSELPKLKRIEGQVRGIAKMVEDERYCIDILHQLKAVKSALATVERNITEAHLNHCVNSAVNSKNRSRTQEVMNEIKDLLKTIG